MAQLKNHRELMIAALTKAVDDCILQDSFDEENFEPSNFDAKISIDFTKSERKDYKMFCNPHLDLLNDPISGPAKLV